MSKCIIKTATVALVTMSAEAVQMPEAPGAKEVEAEPRSPARLLLSTQEDRLRQKDTMKQEDELKQENNEEGQPRRLSVPMGATNKPKGRSRYFDGARDCVIL